MISSSFVIFPHPPRIIYHNQNALIVTFSPSQNYEMVSPSDGGWRSRRLVIAGEIGNLILIGALYLHAFLWLNTLKCEVSELPVTRIKRESLPVDLEDYTIIIGQDTIIPDKINELEERVEAIHEDNDYLSNEYLRDKREIRDWAVKWEQKKTEKNAKCFKEKYTFAPDLLDMDATWTKRKQ
uniref:Uncharacterized protein n=1 Tax=Caenorhabditis tropicalis TaxID=1561998 RepID=A0A1I7USU4_9PELO